MRSHDSVPDRMMMMKMAHHNSRNHQTRIYYHGSECTDYVGHVLSPGTSQLSSIKFSSHL